LSRPRRRATPLRRSPRASAYRDQCLRMMIRCRRPAR
jgi:hypothetical protein